MKSSAVTDNIQLYSLEDDDTHIPIKLCTTDIKDKMYSFFLRNLRNSIRTSVSEVRPCEDFDGVTLCKAKKNEVGKSELLIFQDSKSERGAQNSSQ